LWWAPDVHEIGEERLRRGAPGETSGMRCIGGDLRSTRTRARQKHAPAPQVTNDVNRGLDLPDALGVAGGVLCLLTLWVMTLIGPHESAEQVAYVFLFAVVPFLVAGGLSWLLPRLSLAVAVTVGKVFIGTALLRARLRGIERHFAPAGRLGAGAHRR
jgi:hypothetical protein